MDKPLKGLKVLELATFIAAPTCARALADWGATVTKVESLKGDPLRYVGGNTKFTVLPEENPNFDLCNLNKKSIALNLKEKKGLEIFHKLLQQCDIFITNNRTKALMKMGLDYETLKNLYPSLIFAQVLGYGEKGPLKDKPGFDFTAYYARGGVLGTLYEKDTSPVNPVPGFGDNQVAIALCSGVLAALYKKEKFGIGEKVTVSLYQTAIFALNTPIAASQYGFSYPTTRTEVVNPFLNTYKTKDNRWLQLAAPEYDKFYPKIISLLGRKELITETKYCEFRNVSKNSKEIISILGEAILQKTADEWVEIFENNDVPCEKALLWEEILQDEQAWANNYLQQIHYATGNTRTLVNLPVSFASIKTGECKRGPLLGEDTIEILSNICDDKEIAMLNDEKIALSIKEKVTI